MEMSRPSRWPFADPPNLAVVTVKQILHDGKPVLYVVREPTMAVGSS